MKLSIMLISCVFLSACVRPAQPFIINRSGQDVIIYMHENGRLLLNGCDDVHSPLTSSGFKDEILYIKECPYELNRESKCKDIARRKYSAVATMINDIHEYEEKNGLRAAYLLDKNFNLTLIPYNEKLRVQSFVNGELTCREKK